MTMKKNFQTEMIEPQHDPDCINIRLSDLRNGHMKPGKFIRQHV